MVTLVAPVDKSVYSLFKAVNKHPLFMFIEAERQLWAIGWVAGRNNYMLMIGIIHGISGTTKYCRDIA
jgi:hypothetical protein